MLIWIVRLMVIIAGPIIGYFQTKPSSNGILIGVVIAAAIIVVEMVAEHIPLDTMVASAMGVILGLIGGKIFDYAMHNFFYNQEIYTIYKPYSIYVMIVCAYIGMAIAVRKKDELNLIDQDIGTGKKGERVRSFKILDTSVIIDGRIAEICETRFIEGVFVIPRFVLKELQGIADSSDSMKRNRGRRGLDILKRLQENKHVQIKIYEKDYPDIKEVDIKLVKLASDLGAGSRILTTDFNLNKIASLQGIIVLNVNEMSNAVKPLVLPGEMIKVVVVKEGKEHSQGVAYLDDGTMIVIESGKRYIGKEVDVVVTSVLQTTAGRMIFARLKNKGES